MGQTLVIIIEGMSSLPVSHFRLCLGAGASEGTTCGLDDEGSMSYDGLEDDDNMAGASLFQVR